MPIKYMDFEDRVEREILLAVKAARAGDKCLWIAGFHGERVLGLYKVNAIADIALKSGKSESTVENWAHAVQLVKDLRAAGYSREVKTLRSEFTITHFWTLWGLRRKYGLSPARCMHYFSLLLAYKKNGKRHSSAALEWEVEAGEKRGGNNPKWDYYQKRFQNLYAGAMVADDTPDAVRKWLAKAPASVKVTL